MLVKADDADVLYFIRSMMRLRHSRETHELADRDRVAHAPATTVLLYYVFVYVNIFPSLYTINNP